MIETEQDAAMAKLHEAAAGIVGALQEKSSDAVRKRKPTESRWVEDLCQYHGVRDIGELRGQIVNESVARAGKSSVFANFTRSKTNRAIGRINEILFPSDDKNWGISPTPIPELSTVARRALQEAELAAEHMNQLEQSGAETSPAGLTMPELKQKADDLGEQAKDAQDALDEAKRRAEKMSDLIDDQLTESNYGERARDAVTWACKIGTGILKGPVLVDEAAPKWVQVADPITGQAKYELAPSEDKRRPAVECVSPWAFFPDPSAISIRDAEYVFQRHLPNQRDLKRMTRTLGFDKRAVRDLLQSGPADRDTDTQYLSDLRGMVGETTEVKGRYVLWEYHGSLSIEDVVTLIRAQGGEGAEEMAQAYADNADPLDERMVIAWFCENRLLKLSPYYPLDSGQLLYSVFNYEKSDASILGAIGVPRMMRDNQAMLNAAWRMQADNAALSVSPQVTMDKAKLEPADGTWDMVPGKVWLYDSSNADGGGGTPINFFNVPNNVNEINNIMIAAQAFIDEETSMPRIAEGGGSMEQAAGVTSTVGGLAMLMNAAGVNIRRLVKDWDDDVTAGLIRRIYDWNMQYSEREGVKGDMKAEARGTSVLLAREMQAQNLSALVSGWTVHPVLAPMLNPYQMARSTLQAFQIDPGDMLVSEDEYVRKIEAMSQAPEQAPDNSLAEMQVRMQIAQMETQAKLEIEGMRREVEVLKLAQEGDLTIEQINASLAEARMKLDSDERKFAAELGAEVENAAIARSMGREPQGSGGYVSFGSEAR